MHNIIPDLLDKIIPIESVTPLKDNPKKGDVDAIAASLKQLGQHKPIVARRLESGGEVVAGNHTLLAAKRLGWTEIACVFVDDDEITGKARALADNRTADLGTYDESLIDAYLKAIEDRDLRDATGYNLADWQSIQDKLESLGVPGDSSGAGKSKEEGSKTSPGMGSGTVIAYQLVFNDEQEQQKWFQFIRWLKKTKPDLGTVSERIIEFLSDILPDEE